MSTNSKASAQAMKPSPNDELVPIPPRNFWSRIKSLGPGMVLVVTSVGAGDMVTTLNGSSSYGMALTWTIVLGVLIKFALTEAVGRLQLTSARTLMAQMSDISGPVLPAVFLVFNVVIGLFYGAGLSSVAALAIVELIPGAPLIPVAIGIAVAGGAMVTLGRYQMFERIMVAFGVAMFVTVISTAAMVASKVESPSITFATLVPQLPAGSTMSVLALIGGVGGAGAILGYSYWIREKQWRGIGWIRHMRTDTAVSYTGILIFAVAMCVLGTVLVYGTGDNVAGNSGLAAIAVPIAAIAGEVGRVVFLLCLFAVVFSSILGGFSAIGYLTSDAIRVIRRIPDEHADAHMSSTSPVFRLIIIYCVIAAIAFQFVGRPVSLVVLYATLAAFMLPVLAGALLVLLNRRVLPPEFRSGPLSNIVLGIGFLLFGVLCVAQLVQVFSGQG